MAEAVDLLLAAVVRGEQPVWPHGWAEVNAGQVWDRIRFHGIAYLVAERLGTACHWPQDLRDRIREEAQLQAFWEESHAAMLRDLFARLAGAGVEALVMKGTALAYSVYAEPAARRRGDTDLLVRPGQLAQTRMALRDNGFVPRQNPHGLFFQETWLLDTGIGMIHAVDLHWQANDSPVLQQVLRVDEFFARAQSLPRLAPQAQAPHHVLTFIHGAINQAWHGEHGYFVDGEWLEAAGRLIWAWDNHLLAEAFSSDDWHELVQLSIDRQIAHLSLTSLELCRDRCATIVPRDVIEQLRQAPQETEVVRRLNETNLFDAFFADLRAMSSLKAKVGFIFGHALPSGDHLRSKYPQSAGWPVPLLHLRRMAEVALRWGTERAR